jgi:hypothetical protein
MEALREASFSYMDYINELGEDHNDTVITDHHCGL